MGRDLKTRARETFAKCNETSILCMMDLAADQWNEPSNEKIKLKIRQECQGRNKSRVLIAS